MRPRHSQGEGHLWRLKITTDVESWIRFDKHCAVDALNALAEALMARPELFNEGDALALADRLVDWTEHADRQ